MDGRQSGRVEKQRCTVYGEGRFGALVVVGGLLAEPVAAAAGGKVVERPVQPVPPQEPVERPLRALRVFRIAGDGERGQLGCDEGRSVERLLVAGSGGWFGARSAEVTGQSERPLAEARLVAEPAKRLQPRLRQIFAPERDAAGDQRVRQPRVVVGQCILEPVSAVGRVALIRLRELVDEPLEQPQRLRLQPILVDPRKSEHGVRAGAQRRVRSECPDDLVE